MEMQFGFLAPRAKSSIKPRNLNTLRNYKRVKTQLQDSVVLKARQSSKLEIMFHPSSQLFTGCLFKHVFSTSYPLFVTPFSLTLSISLLICEDDGMCHLLRQFSGGNG